MAHEQDLAATLARVEALEREVALAHERTLEIGAARETIETLRVENTCIPAYDLPAGEQLRLIFGLALCFVAGFDLVAWDPWLTEYPPFFSAASPFFALTATIAGVFVIGLRGPHRLFALLAPLPLAVLLAVRGWMSPFQFVYRDREWTRDINPYVHATYVVPGLLLGVLVVILAFVSRRRSA